MPEKNSDLHGNAPDRSSIVLVFIDVINDLEFEGGAELLKHALPTAERMASLKIRAKAAGIPVVYANDNFGRWRSNFRDVIEHCLNDGVRGEKVARLLLPDENDYFVLKPKHSAFFATPFEVLLEYLQVSKLILTGFTADQCILFTAADAFVRDYQIQVPQDCVASISDEGNLQALAYMRRIMHIDTAPSTALDLKNL